MKCSILEMSVFMCYEFVYEVSMFWKACLNFCTTAVYFVILRKGQFIRFTYPCETIIPYYQTYDLVISDPRRGCYMGLSTFIFFPLRFCPAHISGTVTHRDSKLSVLLGPAV